MYNCTELDDETCLDCINGPANCKLPAPTCFVQGECQGTLILAKPLRTEEGCLGLCKATKGCKWFTFFDIKDNLEQGQLCLLLRDCSRLNETKPYSVSGEQLCQFGIQNGNHTLPDNQFGFPKANKNNNILSSFRCITIYRSRH